MYIRSYFLQFFDHVARHLREAEGRVRILSKRKCEIIANFS